MPPIMTAMAPPTAEPTLGGFFPVWVFMPLKSAPTHPNIPELQPACISRVYFTDTDHSSSWNDPSSFSKIREKYPGIYLPESRWKLASEESPKDEGPQLQDTDTTNEVEELRSTTASMADQPEGEIAEAKKEGPKKKMLKSRLEEAVAKKMAKLEPQREHMWDWCHRIKGYAAKANDLEMLGLLLGLGGDSKDVAVCDIQLEDKRVVTGLVKVVKKKKPVMFKGLSAAE